MINYLLKKKIIDKKQILECIKKVNAWQQQTNNLEEQTIHDSQADKSKTLHNEDLKLNLVEPFPNSIDDLETYLNTKCNLNSSEPKGTSK